MQPKSSDSSHISRPSVKEQWIARAVLSRCVELLAHLQARLLSCFQNPSIACIYYPDEQSPSALTVRPSVHSPSSGASSRDTSPPPFDRSLNGAGTSSTVGGAALLKPSIVIRRGPRGYGFTLRAIRVYFGDSEYYTLHHLVVVSFRAEFSFFSMNDNRNWPFDLLHDFT